MADSEIISSTMAEHSEISSTKAESEIISSSMAEHSEISEWYRNKTIFITGGTGFMGKVLVEKLLRACNVSKIYLLARPKKGLDIKQRIEAMTKLKMFDNVRTNQPDMLQKIIPVSGDITMERLGLSDEDETTLAEEVNVIFHCAATINFQEIIRVAVSMNILGTKRVIALAHKMSNIKALVHVSTCYSNLHSDDIYEELYPAPIDPALLIQITESFDDETLEFLTPKLVAPRPNTYCYTKALAEHVLVNDIGTVPYAIVRPSIVCGSWREPLPGWVDNLFAWTGFLVGMGKGILRSLYTKAGVKCDFIPVDIPINLMITAGWNADVQKIKRDGHNIYNCSSSSQTPLTVDMVHEYSLHIIRKYPLSSASWYPRLSPKYTKFGFQVHNFFMLILPAYIMDAIWTVTGRKTFAVKLCNRMLKAIYSTLYFMSTQWIFHNTNVRSLYEGLSPVDKETFNFDISKLDWKEFFEIYQLGIKKYILKEPMDQMAESHSSMNRLYWIDLIVRLIMLLGTLWIISSFVF